MTLKKRNQQLKRARAGLKSCQNEQNERVESLATEESFGDEYHLHAHWDGLSSDEEDEVNFSEPEDNANIPDNIEPPQPATAFTEIKGSNEGKRKAINYHRGPEPVKKKPNNVTGKPLVN